MQFVDISVGKIRPGAVVMQRDLLDIVVACPERRELADILRTRIVKFLLGGVQFRDRHAPRLKPPVGELIPLLRNLKHTPRVGKLATLVLKVST